MSAPGNDPYDFFGDGLGLSADGRTLVVGASAEDSAATGVNGGGQDGGAPSSGAVFVLTH